MGPQFRRRSREHAGLRVEGHAVRKASVDGPRGHGSTGVGLVVDRQRTVGPQLVGEHYIGTEIHGSVVVELRTDVAGDAIGCSGTQVRDQPNGLIGGVVRPHLYAVRRVEICAKVEGITKNHDDSGAPRAHRTALGTGIVHLPRRSIRGIVRPQLRQPCGIVSRIEIQRVTDEYRHVGARQATVVRADACVRIDIGHKPRGMIRGVVRIELNTRAVMAICAKVEHLTSEHERHVFARIAVLGLSVIAGVDIADQPRGVV